MVVNKPGLYSDFGLIRCQVFCIYQILQTSGI
jgi:hypothetical protein